MTRLGSFLILMLSLAACATLAPRPDGSNPAEGVRDPSGSVGRIGRVGPDGAAPAPLADRGIGGTGAPVAMAPAITADRGIGGTGIVGVVTGFGSVFVDGIEVEYDNSARIDVDGVASSVSALRAGQLVAIQADGPANSPHAKAISVRTAVTGRIEALEPGSGALTIAGQTVLVPDGTWGANRFGPGDWVKVSGLPRDDGTLVASRLDAAPEGGPLARGRVERHGGNAQVGNLTLSGAAAASVKDGEDVTISGNYVAGHGEISSVTADPLWANPAAYFGSSTNRLFVQAFVRIEKGSVSINGVSIKSAHIVAGEIPQDGMAIVSLQRQADGSYTAIDVRYGDYKGHTDGPGQGGAGARTSDGSQVPMRLARAIIPASPQSPNETASISPLLTAVDPYPAPATPVKTIVANIANPLPNLQSAATTGLSVTAPAKLAPTLASAPTFLENTTTRVPTPAPPLVVAPQQPLTSARAPVPMVVTTPPSEPSATSTPTVQGYPLRRPANSSVVTQATEVLQQPGINRYRMAGSPPAVPGAALHSRSGVRFPPPACLRRRRHRSPPRSAGPRPRTPQRTPTNLLPP